MKSVGRALLSPWCLHPLGALILSLIVWFGGPLVSIGGGAPLDGWIARSIVIAVIVALFALLLFLHWRRTRKADKDLVAGIVAGGEKDVAGEAISAERQQLEERLKAALTDLRKSLGKDGQSLYGLPWYTIIGPPGAGKTTALLNSGLRFPLAEKHGAQALKGVGGTRNCDWWFTEKAVILDTAGRYTTQDSDSKVDQAAWGNFLSLLRKTRERQPLNGVLVVFGVPDLLGITHEERVSHARSVRTRLQELQDAFGVTLPIYLVLTKLDMIAGFVEFFDDLDRETREQVLGLTMPLPPPAAGESVQGRFSALFDRLVERQRSRLLDRLQNERDLQRRTLIYGFPTQFASLGRVVDEVLAEAFNDTRYASKLTLRGVYFTSATQQGSPIDRLMGAISSKFGIQQQALPPQVGQGRGFFLRRFFDDVVFNEAGLVGFNPVVERRRKMIRAAAYAASGLFFLAAAGIWTWSFLENRALVESVETGVAALTKRIDEAERRGYNEANEKDLFRNVNHDPRAELSLLNDLRRLPTGFDARAAGKTEAVGFGLGQTERFALQTGELYKRGLRTLLLPRLAMQAQGRLAARVNVRPSNDANIEAGTKEYIFEALKAYRLLGEPGRITPDNAKFLAKWFDDDFVASQVSLSDRTELKAHIEALAADPTWDNLKLDPDLTGRARARISDLTVGARALKRLEGHEALKNRPVWRLLDHVGAQRTEAERVLVRRSKTQLSADTVPYAVPYLYTKKGYYEFFLKNVGEAVVRASTDSWVIGTATTLTGGPALTQATEDTTKSYMGRYIILWKGILEDVALPRLTDPEQAAKSLFTLSGADSPLRNFWEAVVSETQLGTAPKLDQSTVAAGGTAGQRVDRIVSGIGAIAVELTRLLGDGTKAGESVDREFSWLHRFVGPSGATSSQMFDFLRVLESLARKASEMTGPTAALPGASGVTMAQLAQELRTQSGRFPGPVQSLANALASDSRDVGLESTRRQLQEAWQRDVVVFCQQRIAQRYPLNLGAGPARDTTLDDFAEMFAKGQRIDGFVQRSLLPYLDTSTVPWKWRADATPLQLSNAVPPMLYRAQEIRDSFFGPGGAALGVTFTLRPTDGTRKGASLEIGGDVMQLEPGAGPRNMQWPAGAGSGAQVAGDAGNQNFEGQWAFLRVFLGSGAAGGGNRWRMTLSNGVALDLEFRNAKNPLSARPHYTTFQCLPL
ncbi:MAG: type VI secretion system membrane subunit TssM [Rhodospirillales bacterium]|nr:MAG: type VI secretion system membrane subunit TssM [Rhodospirillales bacterium]